MAAAAVNGAFAVCASAAAQPSATMQQKDTELAMRPGYYGTRRRIGEDFGSDGHRCIRPDR
jgi:hypothetical protein